MDDIKEKTAVEIEQELIKYSGSDKVISSYDMLDVLVEDSKKVISIKSTYPGLDAVVGGFEGGELTVVSGPTGNGKTLFSQSLTKKFANQDVNCVWFSFEVMPRQFIKSFDIQLPLFYMPSSVKINSLKWLEQRIHEAKLKYDCRVVFIDHLHFLVDMQTRNNMSLEIGATMRSLKKMALKYNMCFFLIAHTGKINLDMEPEINSLRDSSFIAQEADNVFMIWRNLDESALATIKVVKNRKFGTYKKIKLIKKDMFLEEYDELYGPYNE